MTLTTGEGRGHNVVCEIWKNCIDELRFKRSSSVRHEEGRIEILPKKLYMRAELLLVYKLSVIGCLT